MKGELNKKHNNTAQNNTSSSLILLAYERHANALKRFVKRVMRATEHDVDDVVQEAFLRAYRAEAKGGIQQPKSYLFRVARHVAINQIREKSNRPSEYLEDLDDSSILASELTLEDQVLLQERLGVHCAAVAALPPKRRKVYIMRKVYGMSYKEIADHLGIAINTVEAHLHKGAIQCKAYVESHFDERKSEDQLPIKDMRRY